MLTIQNYDSTGFLSRKAEYRELIKKKAIRLGSGRSYTITTSICVIPSLHLQSCSTEATSPKYSIGKDEYHRTRCLLRAEW